MATEREPGEAWMEPELLRVRGTFLLGKGNAVEAAEQSFAAALAQARATSARAWELRAATSLARLWADRGWRRWTCPLGVEGWDQNVMRL